MPRTAEPRFHEGNKQWCAKIGPPGKDGRPTVVYFPKTIQSKADAWDYFNNYQVSREQPKHDPGTLELADLMEKYLKWAEGEVAAGQMAMHTWKNKRSHLRAFTRFVPPRRADPLAYLKATDLNEIHMAALVREFTGKRSNHYIKNVIRTVVAMMNWAARTERLIPANPIQGWKSGVTTEKVERYADPELVLAFRRWAWCQCRWGWPTAKQLNERVKNRRMKPNPTVRRKSAYRFDRIFLLMIRFIAMTGCRPKEACSSRWSDLKWADESRTSGTIRLDRWKNRKKTGKQRVIFVTPPVARILRAIHDLPGRHAEWIFTHRLGPQSPGYEIEGPHRIAGEPWPDGTALGAKLRKFRKLAVEAGVKSRHGVQIKTVGPNRLANYLFRHTYISDMLMKGHNSSVTAAMTGTSAEMIDRTYGHIQEKHLADVANEMVKRGKA